jgi:O-methyltransferase
MTTFARNRARKVIPARVVKAIRVLRDPDSYSKVVPRNWTYDEDGLATKHNCDFMNDSLFIESYNLGKSTGSWGDNEVHWRAYVACWAAVRARNLEGDFVECGVYKGGLALTVMNYVRFKTLGKKFYLLDTFCGLPAKCITDEERKQGITESHYEDCYDTVVETFKGWNVEIIRGTVPETLSHIKTQKVCYLSLDMNSAVPEIAAAEFLWDRLVSGAVVVLDDYGWSGRIVQKTADDEFASKRGVQVLSLPTGQGLIFKP